MAETALTLKNCIANVNQSVVFIVAYVAAATARTTKSVTVTQLGNSYSTTSGRTAGTDDVSVVLSVCVFLCFVSSEE